MLFRDLVRGLHSGQQSVTDVVQAARAKASDCQKTTNAFLQVFAESELAAQVAHAETLLNNGRATALTGIPVAIKENILIKGHRASAGSKMLDAHVALYDAHVVTQLQEAGAILIGTTNLDEFAMGSSSESSYYGPVRNPLDLNCTAGGSSGGSAAAVACGAVPLALGTDTGGSVRQPAAYCGVVGYKPSYGKLSRYGVVAFASSLDQVGVLSSDVLSAAATMEVMEGRDWRDATTESMAPVSVETILNEEFSLKGLRLALLKETQSTPLAPSVNQLWQSAQASIQGAGAWLDVASAPAWAHALETYYLICCSEASSNLARYDGVRYGFRAAAADLESMYIKSRTQGFGTEVKQRLLLGAVALSSGYFDAFFKKAAQVRRLLVNQLDAVFAEHDFILMPTAPSPAFELGAISQGTMAMYENDVFTVAINLAGLPAISLPFRKDDQLMGLQLVGKRGDDQRLLQAAHHLEQHLADGATP